MKEEMESLVSKIKSRIDPSIIATDVSSFISNSLRKDKMSFYEALYD